MMDFEDFDRMFSAYQRKDVCMDQSESEKDVKSVLRSMRLGENFNPQRGVEAMPSKHPSLWTYFLFLARNSNGEGDIFRKTKTMGKKQHEVEWFDVVLEQQLTNDKNSLGSEDD